MSHKGRSDAGATIPHGRAGLTLKLKDSFAKSADEGGRTVMRISALAFPHHKKICERSEHRATEGSNSPPPPTRVVICGFVVFFLFACLFLFVLVYIILIISKRRPFRKEAWQVRGKAAFSR